MPSSPTEHAWREAALRDVVLTAAMRRSAGVVHTPPPLARFVAKEALALADALGLGGPFLVVDPAIGTGMFPAAALEVAPDRVAGILGFDVDADALRRARRVLGEAATLRHENALGLEAPLAGSHGTPLVVGNPPWASKSASRGTPLSDRMLERFRADPESGAPMRERKIGVLSDDYVRFVRWALEVVRTSGSGGVLGLVTNGSWLDGPVHRGMRATLVASLDEVRIVDLGGSALVARTKGVRDDNPFGVRPSVSIVVGGRRPSGRGGGPVRYARLLGTAEEKLGALAASPAYAPLMLAPPSYAFVARLPRAPAYGAAPSLGEWMPLHREGLQTNRDAFAVDADRDRLVARLDAFVRGEHPLVPSAHFDPTAASIALGRALEDAVDGWIRRCDYRPFDRRWYVRHPSVCHRPRPDLAAAIERSAFVLVTTRKDRGALPFRHLAVVRAMPDSSFLSARSACRSRAVPTHGPDGVVNASEDVVLRLGIQLGRDPEATEVAAYVAAVLGAPSYQRAFDEALRTDLPRIPLPRSADELLAIVAAGHALAAAWLSPAEGPRHPRAASMVIGHHAVGDHPMEASAIAWAEDACDAAIASLLEATLRS